VTSSCADLSPEYGIVNLKITPSQEVFFKREVRGQNYDALVLSPSKDLCSEPNPRSDYIFKSQGPHRIYYKVEDGTLILFLTIAAPLLEEGAFPIRVVQNKMHTLEFEELQKNYRKLGLVELKVEIDRGLKCR
jgi:hypothetical protein